MLQETNQVRILGRDHLRMFGPTEFDWNTHRVRLGSVWKDTRVILEGGDALSRSAVAALDTEVHTAAYSLNSCTQPGVSINPSLPPEAIRQLKALVYEFSDVFAENPKSPTITPHATHVIDTGRHLPVKHKLQFPLEQQPDNKGD